MTTKKNAHSAGRTTRDAAASLQDDATRAAAAAMHIQLDNIRSAVTLAHEAILSGDEQQIEHAHGVLDLALTAIAALGSALDRLETGSPELAERLARSRPGLPEGEAA